MKRIVIPLLLLYGTGSQLAARRLYVEPHREGDHDGLKLFIFVCLLLLGISFWYDRKRVIADKQLTDKNDTYESEK